MKEGVNLHLQISPWSEVRPTVSGGTMRVRVMGIDSCRFNGLPASGPGWACIDGGWSLPRTTAYSATAGAVLPAPTRASGVAIVQFQFGWWSHFLHHVRTAMRWTLRIGIALVVVLVALTAARVSFVPMLLRSVVDAIWHTSSSATPPPRAFNAPVGQRHDP